MTQIDDFLDGEKMVGGLKLRPLTFGSKAACDQMGLTMFTSGETPTEQAEVERQLVAFAWMHTEPLSEVITALRNGTAEAAAFEFGFAVDLGDAKALTAEIERIAAASVRNSVDVEPRPGSGRDDAPGN
jgi:hypothetical protein